MAKNDTPKTNRVGRPRVDWHLALRYFLELPPAERHFARVAAKFGCSDVAVGQHARKNGWEAKAAEVDRKALAAAERASGKTAEERMIQTVRLRDLAAAHLERKLSPGEEGKPAPDLDDMVAVRVLRDTDRMTRLDAGTATDRVAVGEVNALVDQLVADVAALVPPGKRAELLAVLDRAQSKVTAAAHHDPDRDPEGDE